LISNTGADYTIPIYFDFKKAGTVTINTSYTQAGDDQPEDGVAPLDLDKDHLISINLPDGHEVTTPNPSPPEGEKPETVEQCLVKHNYSKWVTAYDDDGKVSVTFDLKRPVTLHGM